MGKQGVVQGSPSSGNLFTLYVNKLPAQVRSQSDTKIGAVAKKCKKKSLQDDQKPKSVAKEYVDDVNIIAQAKTLTLLKIKLVQDFQRTKIYLQNHKMIINADKTQLMFCNPPTKKSDLSIVIDGVQINHQKSIRILGITLSDNLLYDNHIWAGSKNIVKSLNYKVSLLKTLKPFLPYKAMSIIGNGLVNSTILYGATVWGSTKQASIEKIQKVQIKAGRVINGFGSKGRKSHRQNLLEKLQWPNVNQIIDNAILNQTKRALNNKTSAGLNQVFTSKEPRHQRVNLGTRISNNIPLSETKSSFSKKAQELFNNLPSFLRDKGLTTQKFKQQLKPHIGSTQLLTKH